MNKTAEKTAVSAVFAALTFVFTLISFPVGAGGYVNLGDAIVLICAYACGGLYGALCAPFGAAIADVVLGFAVYAPATFVVKLTVAAVSYCAVCKKYRGSYAGRALRFAACELIMVAGYFVYDYFVLGYGIGAVYNSIFNLMQGAICAAVSSFIVRVIGKYGKMFR
ncbi:MAG: ECF transporter S component [Clostridia bacterium]|nr:ECF transporter S component [Clostridia bacterium]